MGKRHLVRKRPAAFAAAGLSLLLASASLPAAGIYQWRDADGNLHFGDAPPEQEQAADLSSQYDNSLPFDVVIEGVDYGLPNALRDRIAVSVRKIFTIYEQSLGVSHATDKEFRIVIYGTEAGYLAYQRKVAPLLKESSAFYNSQNNQITTWGMREDALLQVIIHECSHAIFGDQKRWIPTWLNEGLAEYFEPMHVFGLGAEIPAQQYWLRTLRQASYHRQPAPDLLRYLNAGHQDWYTANAGDSTLSYASSWSLVYFMMDSQTGRTVLKALLDRTLKSPVPLMDSAGFIDQRWPGGLSALRDDWQRWLASTESDRHRY